MAKFDDTSLGSAILPALFLLLASAGLHKGIVARANVATVGPLSGGGSCRWSRCSALRDVGSLTPDSPSVGFFLGSWNKNYLRSKAYRPDGPLVNFQVFTEMGVVLALSPATTLSECCKACAARNGCGMFHFFDKSSPRPGMKVVEGFQEGTQCYLLRNGDSNDEAIQDMDGVEFDAAPYSGNQFEQRKNMKVFDPSWVGGICNKKAVPMAEVGARFTKPGLSKVEFESRLDHSFCLVSDTRLQVNVVLGGYQGSWSAEAQVLATGKALRSQIKEIGLVWIGPDEKIYHAHFIARGGKVQHQTSDDTMLMSRMKVNGEEFTVPKVGETRIARGGFEITLASSQSHGVYHVDHFEVTIADLAEIDLRIRLPRATELRGRPKDAEAHFDVRFAKLRTTPAVHGLLGQALRGKDSRSETRKTMQVPGSAGISVAKSGNRDETRGAEGKAGDYATSGPLSSDCKFSAFGVV